MKEQQHRFGDKTSKENVEDVTPKDSATKPQRPQLAITISMSEEAEDPASQTPRETSPFANLTQMDVVGEDFGNDVSAWAMMEHYEMKENRSSPLQNSKVQDGQCDSVFLKDTSTFWDKSFSREQGSLQLSPESQDGSRSEATPSTISRTTQNIFVLNHADEISSPVSGSKMFKWNLQSPSCDQQLLEHHAMDELESQVDTRPTPAKLKARWIEEKKLEGDMESPPVSMLQDSLILSDGTNFNTTTHSNLSVTSDANIIGSADDQFIDQSSLQALVPLDDESVTQFSKASFQPSTRAAQFSQKSINPNNDRSPLLPNSLLPATNAEVFAPRKSDFGDVGVDFAHLEKIEQLERDLRQQRENTDQMQMILKERVMELEHALRATVTTPRGTIVQENPLKTLLDRNQTLVKEVRFADSTCVELSARVSALEAEKQILIGQVSTLQKENKDLRKDYEHALIEAASASRNDDQTEFSWSHSGVTRPFPDDEGILRQAIDDLKAEVSALANEQQDPFVSMATSLLSEVDTSLDRGREVQGALDKSFTSQCLAKALQAQVRLLKEQKQMVKQNQELEVQLELARSRKEEFDFQLEKERLDKNANDNSNHSLDLSRAQEESDFLGRQLGKVQESLDRAQQELEEERKKSVAIDSKWRTETAGHLRKIMILEEKLERASQSLSFGNCGDGASSQKRRSIDLEVMNIEQDLLNAKAALMSFKRDMETLLSKDLLDVNRNCIGSQDCDITKIVIQTTEKMRQHYSSLNLQVEQILTQYGNRLEHLTETVGFLRASLLFEADSVSTATATPHQRHGASPERYDRKTNQVDDDEENDGDMYSRMEEARGSPPRYNDQIEDMSSDLDDISRLFSDDSTLESMLRTAVSEKSAYWEFDALKKPLEAAIRECQRVRDRSVALKEELRSEKIAFEQLEMENRRILLEYSRKDEEKQLVHEALEEAKARIYELQSKIDELSEQNAQLKGKSAEIETRCNDLEVEKLQLQTILKDTINKREETEDRLTAVRAQMEDAKQELKSAYASADERERAYVSLKSKIEDIEAHAFETEDMLLESRCKQEDMRKERAELKAQLARSESEIQSVRESLERTNERSQKQFEDMSTTIKFLESQHDDAQTLLRHFSSVYHDIFNLFDRSDKVSFSKASNKPESAYFVDWSLLAQVVPFISSTLDGITEKQTEIDSLQTGILRLQQDFKRSTELGSQYQKQVEDEKAQNKKLAELLHQAEQEMERSVGQIREMSSALSQLQQQEAEMVFKTQSLEQERESMQEELSQIRNALCQERKLAQHRGNELSHELSCKRKNEEELRSTIESLESKSSRLREYVKKLTIKCEEWEKSYERQGKSLEKLQTKHARMREKACEMAARYKQLSGHVKSKSRVSRLIVLPSLKLFNLTIPLLVLRCTLKIDKNGLESVMIYNKYMQNLRKSLKRLRTSFLLSSKSSCK